MRYSSATLLSVSMLSASCIYGSAFSSFQPGTSYRSDTSLSAKKIFLAFDGTGNNARDFAPNHEPNADPPIDVSGSNILKLHLLAGGDINGRRNDVPGQISIYERGIGGKSDSKLIRTLRSIGGDLSRQTEPMREKLEAVYEKGDRLYIVGYSRGAAAARQFSSELHDDGLLTAHGEKVESPPIEFLGCFETVSMQTKDRLFSILRTRNKSILTCSSVVGEKDGKIPPNVVKAVHNVALNDNRMVSPPMWFPPVFMDSEDDRVHETWFAGEHGDIGGTYYTKGMPDGSCKYMQEWIESLDDSLRFIQPEEINPECLAIDNYPDIKLNKLDFSINPDPTDKLHMKGQQLDDPSFRPVVTVSNNEIVKDGTVRVHESVLHHMEAMTKKGTPYEVNPNMKKTKVVIVGPLGKELEAETKKFAELLESH